MSGFTMLPYSCRVCGERFAQSTLSKRCAESHAEPSADYARGRADGIAAALSAVRTHWATQAERQHVPGLRPAIETLEKLR